MPAEIGIHSFWSFLLIFARMSALFVTAPVMGNKSVPAKIKIGLAGMISLALLPSVERLVGTPPADLFTLLGQVASETVVGICLGYLVTLLMGAFEIAGHFLDTQMGFNIMSTLNPFSGEQSSPIGQFLYQFAMVTWLTVGGHLLLINALAQSFDVVGPGGGHFTGQFIPGFMKIVMEMLILAFKIAVPAAAVLFVGDVALGIIARSMPQMNVFIVGLPLKVIIGILVLVAVMPPLAHLVGSLIPLTDSGATILLKAAR